MKRIVIASDSFKGSLSSAEVAESLGRALTGIDPECSVSCVQVADGGEGTVAAIASLKALEWHKAFVRDPLGRKITSSFASGDGGTALLEMSAASGLPLLSPEERNPLLTSTCGTGEMILAALDLGCRNFVVGIGGSATNDAGTGMLQSLGAKFLDDRGQELAGCGKNLISISSIDLSGLDLRLKDCTFSVACDVDNPFYGPQGAAFVFGPQKGADEVMVKDLDEGLRHFAEIIRRDIGIDLSNIPGAGAAGGLGGALLAFLGAQLKPGVDVVLDSIGFDSLISGADLIITGEGRLDSQTASGKTPMGVLKRADRQGIPVVAVGGCIKRCPELEALGFKALYATAQEGIPLETAMSREYTTARLSELAGVILKENLTQKKDSQNR